jgi:hypothetical protein
VGAEASVGRRDFIPSGGANRLQQEFNAAQEVSSVDELSFHALFSKAVVIMAQGKGDPRGPVALKEESRGLARAAAQQLSLNGDRRLAGLQAQPRRQEE